MSSSPSDPVFRLAHPGPQDGAAISWLGLIEAADNPLPARGILHIASPGRFWPVEAALIRLGAPGGEPVEDRGSLAHAGAWRLGFARLMGRLAAWLAERPGLVPTHRPDELAALFDKSATQARLAEAGCRVPARLPPVGDYADLRRAMEAAGLRDVFVKLRGGSSGAGVAALRTASGGRAMLTAPLEWADGRLYASRRLARWSGEAAVASILDALLAQGCHAEAWVPKPMLDGLAYDLRLLVIAGRARHRLARLSRGPVTNLHLLNRRRPAGDLPLSPEEWRAVEAMAERAAAAFPGCLHIGVDLVPTRRGPVVLECNAFGDRLPGLVHDGETTAEAIESALGRGLRQAA